MGWNINSVPGCLRQMPLSINKLVVINYAASSLNAHEAFQAVKSNLPKRGVKSKRETLLSRWITKTGGHLTFSLRLPWSPKVPRGLFLSSTASPSLNLIVRATTETCRPCSSDDWVDSRPPPPPKGQNHYCQSHRHSLSGTSVLLKWTIVLKS